MTTESFTCPVCGRTSWHPTDVVEQWCGACHGATGHPAPPGLRWVLFLGGPDDPRGRLVNDPIEQGAEYTMVVDGARYLFDGQAFVLQPRQTRWTLSSIGRKHDHLNIELTVDTTSETVCEAIETAAANNGIVIERQA